MKSQKVPQKALEDIKLNPRKAYPHLVRRIKVAKIYKLLDLHPAITIQNFMPAAPVSIGFVNHFTLQITHLRFMLSMVDKLRLRHPTKAITHRSHIKTK